MNKQKTIFPCWDNDKKSYTKGGRVQCDICGSFKGVKSRNYLRKDKKGKTFMKLFMRCANCQSLEVRNNYTGEILLQVKKEV
jgi:hypothetical protein